MKIDLKCLHRAGFLNTDPDSFEGKTVELRDGRSAIVWIHRETGHGILDSKYWQNLDDYYSEDYRKDSSAILGKKISPSEHTDIYKKFNLKQYEVLFPLIHPETKYLEIGCSYGDIFSQVAAAGVDICHGVEPNVEDAKFVQNRNKSAHIYNSLFENSELSEKFYDLIASFEVLEHVKSPADFIEKTALHLKSGGRIHITVPNHRDILMDDYENEGYKKFYYHKAHIHYFTKKSIERMFLEGGFEGSASTFSMYPFFNHVWWHQNHGPQSSASIALATPQPGAKSSLGELINGFYEKVENDYEVLLNSNGMGDHLLYQGTLKK